MRGKSKNSIRKPLQPLSTNELNKRNRIHTQIKPFKRLSIEVIDDNNDSIKEPPKKKRKSTQRSILSPVPISDHRNHNHNTANRYRRSPISSLTFASNRGSIFDLRSKNRINVDDISRNLKLNNQELTQSIIKYKEKYKSQQEKCKSLQHENKTFKKMIKIFNNNDKNLKKQRRIDQDEIASLENKIENITNELNRNLKPDHCNQQTINQLNQRINEYEYECQKWKNRYYKLQQNNNNNEVFIKITFNFILVVINSVISLFFVNKS